jgi:hypothetical protein
VNRTLPYFSFSVGEDPRIYTDGLQDRSHLFHAKASLINLDNGEVINASNPEQLLASSAANIAIGVEFIGTRFLRHMVRILAVSCF